MSQKILPGDMWSEEIGRSPEIEKGIDMRYLYFKQKDFCGHDFREDYIGNLHASRKIIATVKTIAVYMGEVTGESIKKILVPPGKDKEVLLGCSGFAHDTGGYDTHFKRTIIHADWEHISETVKA